MSDFVIETIRDGYGKPESFNLKFEGKSIRPIKATYDEETFPGTIQSPIGLRLPIDNVNLSESYEFEDEGSRLDSEGRGAQKQVDQFVRVWQSLSDLDRVMLKRIAPGGFHVDAVVRFNIEHANHGRLNEVISMPFADLDNQRFVVLVPCDFQYSWGVSFYNNVVRFLVPSWEKKTPDRAICHYMKDADLKSFLHSAAEYALRENAKGI